MYPDDSALHPPSHEFVSGSDLLCSPENGGGLRCAAFGTGIPEPECLSKVWRHVYCPERFVPISERRETGRGVYLSALLVSKGMAEDNRILLIASAVSTFDLTLLGGLDFTKNASRRRDLLSVTMATNKFTYREDEVRDTHGNGFSTSAVTASHSLVFIFSKSCSSLACVSACRPVRVSQKRCKICFLRPSQAAYSLGNLVSRPDFIIVSKDASSIFSERHNVTSSMLKIISSKVVHFLIEYLQ